MRRTSFVSLLAAAALVAACEQRPPQQADGGDPSTIDPRARGMTSEQINAEADARYAASRAAAEASAPCPPPQYSQGQRVYASFETPIRCMGPQGPLAAADAVAACSLVWDDLMGNWTGLSMRAESEGAAVADLMTRGRRACETLRAALAADASAAPGCVRFAEDSVTALRQFTDGGVPLGGPQSMSLVQGVREARAACPAAAEAAPASADASGGKP